MPLELMLTLVAVFVFVAIVVTWIGSIAASWTATGRKRLREVVRTSQPVLLPEIMYLSTPTQTGTVIGPSFG